MKRYHKRTVQLTSLLDLLFIMVFIALMMEPPKDPPDPVVQSCEGEVSQLQKDLASCEDRTKAMAENIRDLEAQLSKQDRKYGGSDSGNTFRRLFMANVYQLKRNKYVFNGTTLIVGDEDMGTAWMFSLRQANNSAYRPQKLQPMEVATAEKYQECSNVVISRDRLKQECLSYGRVHRSLDCKRTDGNTYICSQEGIDKTNNKKWNIQTKFEILKIYDPNLL